MSQQKPPAKKTIPIQSKYADGYKEIFLNNIVGGIRDGYVELDLITEATDFEESIKTQPMDFTKTEIRRTIHAKVLNTIYSFKSQLAFLQGTLQKYEEVFGPIQEPQQPKKKVDTTSADKPSFIG